ncbi:hypothetical protein TSAR_013386 [Trichomalopsis sarcophagae]|uniref:Peptidase S1 domain-containing protein n=1 Tax=Trichomalopsis sarcophagae TaxID=543379 RepID=A0A232EYD8_9HYME|nr:hypothetical protein TSAR_013386 [Trichomalopsis sarcophagae]
MKTLFLLTCISLANCFYIENGISKKDKIVNGEDIDIKHAPYQVSLLRLRSPFCGGTIIAKSWVVTAGHCIKSHLGVVTEKSTLSVRTATSSLLATGTRHQIEEVIIHPEYNHKNYDNDIVLIKLRQPLEFNAEQGSIPLAQPDDVPYPGQIMQITGFGKVGEHYGYSKTLKLALVPVVSFDNCARVYESIDPITDNMFCAGDGKADACQGDSGGPAVINNKLAGVVSSGIGCASGFYPGIYTRVDKYYDWIMQTTNYLS